MARQCGGRGSLGGRPAVWHRFQTGVSEMRRNLVTVAMMVLFLGLTASAQDTPVLLYKYPNTINNTTGIVSNSFLAQGPDGLFFDTIYSNGAYNNGSVYTMSLTGEYAPALQLLCRGRNLRRYRHRSSRWSHTGHGRQFLRHDQRRRSRRPGNNFQNHPRREAHHPVQLPQHWGRWIKPDIRSFSGQ